ncbi:MAG: ecdysteroid 22-kinase family protein [Acidimicrobiia bacterium]|nr:ecdysteroid 22-kinase family protein [Acidimicrobiia bacterium]
MPAVPGSIGEISAAWLDAALQTGGPDPAAALDVVVGAVVVEPLGPAVGLLGDLARLRITYDRGTGPATMIVKLPTSDPGGHQVGSMLRAWAREVAFYTEVAPVSPGARVPRCYYAAGDAAAERWVVVLEDCPADPVDAATGATPTQAVAAVDALAGFHASWWQADRRFEWMPGFDSTGIGGLQGPWLDALPTFLERYGHVVPEPTGQWIQRFAPELGAWSAKAATEPLTVVHADYRLDNLLFAGDEVTIIDWQTALRGPGAMDLTCFCITSLTVEGRRATEAELVARYLDTLGAAGVTVDPEWFAHSYDENLLWWMGQFANNLARLEPDDPDTQAALDTMIERTYTAALDHDVGRLLS